MLIKKSVYEKWENYSLQIKLVILFVATITTILFINCVLFVNINMMLNRVDRIYVSNVTLNQLSQALTDVQTSVKEYLDTKSSDALENYYSSEIEYRKLLLELNSKIVDDEMLLTEKNIRNLSEDYLDLVLKVINAKRGRDVEQYKTLYQEAQAKYNVINMFIYSLNNEQFKNNTNQYHVLLASLKYMEITNVIMMVTAAFLDILYIIILTGSITRPLKELTEAVGEVASGNFDITVPVHGGRDEVGILSSVFNQMTMNIQNYIVQIKESMEKESAMKEKELMMESHLKDAQLKYLQAQINPHFLFNTLNAGAQLAMLEGADKTTIFIENMADFFRYNLKKINEDTTISEELRLVDSYIYILNVRFSGEINYQKNVDESLGDISVPSMILQPLVENAVNYGIRGLDREGIIEVSVYKQDQMICISVWDNGIGMTEEQIQKAILGQVDEAKRASGSNGIGVRNVIERLQLYFGYEKIFQIESEGLDLGTEVIIKIPEYLLKD